MRLAGGVARIPGRVNLVLRTGPVNHFPHRTDLDCTAPTAGRPLPSHLADECVDLRQQLRTCPHRPRPAVVDGPRIASGTGGDAPGAGAQMRCAPLCLLQAFPHHSQGAPRRDQSRDKGGGRRRGTGRPPWQGSREGGWTHPAITSTASSQACISVRQLPARHALAGPAGAHRSAHPSARRP